MSFNRNLKRVAGPGFHINVRYDDAQIHKQQNATDANATINKGLRLKEIWDVKEQELLVTMDSSKQANYFDGYTHCFSSANNWPGTSTTTDPKALKEKILNDVKFVGIATTEFIPKRGYMEQGFVAQVGGVTTLINESEDNIYPGDKVMLDVNTGYGRKVTRDKGIPREKIRFTVRRAYTTDEAIKAALIGGTLDTTSVNTSAEEEALKNAKASLATARAASRRRNANDAQKQAATDAENAVKAAEQALAAKRAQGTGVGGMPKLKAFLQRLRSINDRVIGKAYSFARPGDRLEVGLQPRSEF